MDVKREIVVQAPVDEVWSTLTEPERLEEWFANEVELELEPGGEGTFRWDDGDERHAVVEEVVPERRFAFTWDDSRVEIELEPRSSPARACSSPRPAGAGWGTRALAARTRSRLRVTDVFAALADPSRRRLLEELAGREASVTELAPDPAGDAPGSDEAHGRAAQAQGWSSRASVGRETLYRLNPAPLDGAAGWIARVGSEWDARLGRLRDHVAPWLSSARCRRGADPRRA